MCVCVVRLLAGREGEVQGEKERERAGQGDLRGSHTYTRARAHTHTNTERASRARRPSRTTQHTHTHTHTTFLSGVSSASLTRITSSLSTSGCGERAGQGDSGGSHAHTHTHARTHARARTHTPVDEANVVWLPLAPHLQLYLDARPLESESESEGRIPSCRKATHQNTPTCATGAYAYTQTRA